MIMTSWFPLALKGDAQTWFLNLPKNSIRSWRALKEHFLGAFQGGYERPGVPGDLYALKQHPGETLYKYIQRFTQNMNTIPCIKQELVIASFHTNVRTVRMREKLSNHQVKSTRKLWELADREKSQLQLELQLKKSWFLPH